MTTIRQRRRIAEHYQGSVNHALAVTPNDVEDLPNGPTIGLYVGSTGNISLILEGQSAPITFVSIAAGVVHPLRVVRVRSTGTNAANILACYQATG